MNNLLSKETVLKRHSIPGNIEIVNGNNEVLASFENNLALVDENHKDIKSGNFLVINNPSFKITFSCDYINTWTSKRKKELYEKYSPKNKKKSNKNS